MMLMVLLWIWTTHTGVGVPNLGLFYDGSGNPIAESTFTAECNWWIHLMQ